MTTLSGRTAQPADAGVASGYVVQYPDMTPDEERAWFRKWRDMDPVDKLDLANASRIAREKPEKIEQLRSLLPAGVTLDESRVAMGTRFWEVTGRIRLDQRVLQERVLVERRADGEMVILRREHADVAPSPR